MLVPMPMPMPMSMPMLPMPMPMPLSSDCDVVFLPKVSLDNELAPMFGTMERAKDELGIENYSISQTTLESIFNAFAAKQKEETETAPGMA